MVITRNKLPQQLIKGARERCINAITGIPTGRLCERSDRHLVRKMSKSGIVISFDTTQVPAHGGKVDSCSTVWVEKISNDSAIAGHHVPETG